MRRWLIIAGIVLAWPGASPAQEKAVGRRPEARKGQNWALIIGIDGYVHQPTLTYCVDDAKLLAETLQSKCGYDKAHVYLLVDGVSTFKDNPTRDNILHTAELVAGLPKKQDTLLFYFSGHGIDIDDGGYLVPIEARNPVPSELVSIGKFRERLRASRAERKVMILDACHSGTEKSAEDAAMTKAFEASMRAEAEGIVTLASCRASETSLEAPWYKQGLFTYWLVRGLRGGADTEVAGNKDGRVEVHELYQFVSERVSAEAVKRKRHRQNPYFLAAMSGRIDLAHLSKTEHGSDAIPPSQAENESGTVRVEGGRLIVTVRVPCKSDMRKDVLPAKRLLLRVAEGIAMKALHRRGIRDVAAALNEMNPDDVRLEGGELVGVYSLPIRTPSNS